MSTAVPPPVIYRLGITTEKPPRELQLHLSNSASTVGVSVIRREQMGALSGG